MSNSQSYFIILDGSNITSAASQAKGNRGGIIHDFMLKAKVLEINPRSPLIEGLLRRVKDLPAEDEDQDIEAEEELKEVTAILIDGALVRSGFEVTDNNKFVLLTPMVAYWN